MTVSSAFSDSAHLLRRAGFGAPRATVDQFARLPLAARVDRLLDLSKAPPAVKPAIVNHTGADQWNGFLALHNWWLDRMAGGGHALQEKMTLFWHGHFATSQDKVFDMQHMWDQQLLFRSHALGNFRAIVQSMAVQPAMLLYLDNASNVKGAPNENFARELMELFTLGVGNYSQDDVVAAARAWTGYGYDWDTKRFEYQGYAHDGANKRFMGVTRAWTGPQIIDFLLSENHTTKMISARFVAKKLWRYFAGFAASAGRLDQLGKVFYDHDLEIAPLVRAILTAPEFYSSQAKLAQIASPAVYVARTLRSFHQPANVLHPEWYMDSMGQVLLYPPNVAGWKDNGYWMSTGQYDARGRWARDIQWMMRNRGLRPMGSVTRLSARDAVARALDVFEIHEPSPNTRFRLESWLIRQRRANLWLEWEPINLCIACMLTPEYQLS